MQAVSHDVSSNRALNDWIISLSTAFTVFLVSIMFACGSVFHDGTPARSVIAILGAVAIACISISARAADVNLAARCTRGLKLVAAVPPIWMVIQLLPIPIGAHSIWSYANEALGRQAWGHVSVDLGVTILALAFYLANISLIVVSLFMAKDRRGAELLLSVLTWITAATTIALLVGKSGLMSAIDAASLNDPLCAISALGVLLALASAVRAIEQHETHNDERKARTRYLAFLASGLALAIGIAGIGFGGSFNKFLVAGFGIAIFGSIQVIRRAGLPGWAALMLMVTMLLATTMVVIWRCDSTGAVAPLLQFATAAPVDAISLAQRMLSDAGWSGTGAGTFTSLLPIYQDLGSSITKPPSTASVLAIELGWPMFAVVIATAVWLIAILYRGALARGRDSFYPAVAAACAVVILGEAFCDTSLLSSCIAVVGAAIIGLGLAQHVSARSGQ